MLRPTEEPPLERTRVVSFKCDAHWLAALDEQARRCGISRSALIRAAVDEIEVHEAPDRGYQDLAIQLTKIGTLYNQAVRLAHQTRHQVGTIPADALLDALGTHQATLARILRALVAQHPLRSAPPS